MGLVDDVLANAPASVTGLSVRVVDPGDPAGIARWADLFVAGSAIGGAEADAWRRLNPVLARAHGYRQLIAALDGRDVAVAALFNRRRVGWLGGAAVLPEARGRGIQRALILDRVRRAAEAGSTRVMATADMGSPSEANLETLGIRRIWTRGLYPFDPAGSGAAAPNAARMPG